MIKFFQPPVLKVEFVAYYGPGDVFTDVPESLMIHLTKEQVLAIIRHADYLNQFDDDSHIVIKGISPVIEMKFSDFLSGLDCEIAIYKSGNFIWRGCTSQGVEVFSEPVDITVEDFRKLIMP